MILFTVYSKVKAKLSFGRSFISTFTLKASLRAMYLKHMLVERFRIRNYINVSSLFKCHIFNIKIDFCNFNNFMTWSESIFG